MRTDLVLRFDYGSVGAVGQPASTTACCAPSPALTWSSCGPRRSCTARACARWASSTWRRASRVPFALTYAPVPPADCRRRSTQPPHSPTTESVLARMVGSLPSGGRMVGCRAALADHAQGADLRPDRRHRGGADHLAAGTARRRAQLGLPLLLAARRHLDPDGADRALATPTRRATGATGCCARSPAARRRCRSCTASPASAA